MKYQRIIGNIKSMSGYKKHNYILKKIMFKRFMPIALALIFLNSLFGYNDVSTVEFVYSSIINTIFILAIAVIAGGLEWDFYKSLNNSSLLKISDIRNRFIFNFGILGFGLPIGIGSINWSSTPSAVALKVSIWIISGVFFGLLTWRSESSEFRKYIDSKESNTLD